MIYTAISMPFLNFNTFQEVTNNQYKLWAGDALVSSPFVTTGAENE